MVFFIESGNLSEILRIAVIDFLRLICYDETKRQVHGMREILLLEDDGALGRGIQLALQDPDVTISLNGTITQAL